MSFWSAVGGAALNLGTNIVTDLFKSQQDKAIQKSEQETQREFAQHGIRWKVADARAAGLHPLAALGAQTHSYAPTRVGSGLDYGMSRFGQDISRAIRSTKTKKEKILEDLQLREAEAKVNNMELQNMILARERRTVLDTPNFPEARPTVNQAKGISLSQGDVDKGVQLTPKQIIPSQRQGIEVGLSPLEQEVVDNDGYIRRMPSKEIAEVMESSLPDQFQYTAEKFFQRANSIYRFLTPDTKESKRHREKIRAHRRATPKGYEYRYNPWKNAYKLFKQDGHNRLYDVPIGSMGSHFKQWSERR